MCAHISNNNFHPTDLTVRVIEVAPLACFITARTTEACVCVCETKWSSKWMTWWFYEQGHWFWSLNCACIILVWTSVLLLFVSSYYRNINELRRKIQEYALASYQDSLPMSVTSVTQSPYITWKNMNMNMNIHRKSKSKGGLRPPLHDPLCSSACKQSQYRSYKMCIGAVLQITQSMSAMGRSYIIIKIIIIIKEYTRRLKYVSQ